MPPQGRGRPRAAQSPQDEGDDSKRKIVSVGFPPDMLKEINAYAMIMGTSSNDAIRIFVSEGLARSKKSPDFRRRARAFVQNAYDQVRILTGEDFELDLTDTKEEESTE